MQKRSSSFRSEATSSEEAIADILSVLIEGAASYRLTRLVVLDSLTEPIRQAIFDRYPPPGWLLNEGDRPKALLFNPIGKVWQYGLWDPQQRRIVQTQNLPLDAPGRFFAPNGTKLGEMLHCLWCAGIWSSFVVVAVSKPRLLRHPLRFAVRSLAVAAVGALGVKYIER